MTIVTFHRKVSICYHGGKGKDRRGKVTQLVGALCENRTKVVLISDRMVMDEDESLAFEHEAKVEILSSQALALTAGSVHEPELLEDVRAEISIGKESIRQIADSLAQHYGEIRRKRMEREILRKYGIASFDEFYNNQQRLHEDTNYRILNEIDKYKLDVGYILGGFDQKAHLYIIDEPGTYDSHDAVGFCCMGSGGRHADPVFAFFRYNPSMSESDVLQIAYAAKKRAEMAGGVGKQTDAWIINKDGCYEVEEAHETQEGLFRMGHEIKVKKRKLGKSPDKARGS